MKELREGKSAFAGKFRGIAIVLIAAVLCFCVMYIFNALDKRVYDAEHFGIETVKSSVDFNGNGVDDYTDILLGARKDAENHPDYDGRYWEEGYPPDNIGVCTDVVWRAFANAGYSIRDMVDRDVHLRPEAYYQITVPDRNIDFRRVRNLTAFFDEYAIILTNDIDVIEQWQPGDIVTFNDDKHIGIVSDKRNSQGRPYIIHNGGQKNREEDFLGKATVSGHYRFDAANVSDEVLVKWNEEDMPTYQ